MPKRLNLALDEAAAKNIDKLVNMTDASSKTQALQRALSLYHFVVQEQEKGKELLLKSPDGSEQRLALLFS